VIAGPNAGGVDTVEALWLLKGNEVLLPSGGLGASDPRACRPDLLASSECRRPHCAVTNEASSSLQSGPVAIAIVY
jgi:hypothetical protein